MISAGVEGRHPYMTYPEPWRGPPKQPPEFLRPAPKPLPSSARYNGLNNTAPNGVRLTHPQQRPPNKYSSSPAVAPVNLTQHKEDVAEEIHYAYPRLFTTPTFGAFHHSPYPNMYQTPYTPLLRSGFGHPPPLSPLETYSPTTSTSTNSGTFLSPPAAYSPPSNVKPSQTIVRDRKQPATSFKLPSGKEGSLKHRILTRPEDGNQRTALDLQRPAETHRKRSSTTTSPPQSPAKPLNNNVVPVNFAKGSLIQLASGELRKVEDMKTEDFVLSAEISPELRLADSTVVKIGENPITATVTITLTYNQRRTQAEVEYPLEHPFFVYGKGWASCNPDRTFQCYGLKVHNLQVGDIIISVTPRTPTPPSIPPRSSTIITTATTTAMTVRQISSNSYHQRHSEVGLSQSTAPTDHSISHLTSNQMHQHQHGSCNTQFLMANQQHQQSLSPDSMAKKRRWSAPDQICDEEEQLHRRVKIE